MWKFSRNLFSTPNAFQAQGGEGSGSLEGPAISRWQIRDSYYVEGVYTYKACIASGSVNRLLTDRRFFLSPYFHKCQSFLFLSTFAYRDFLVWKIMMNS